MPTDEEVDAAPADGGLAVQLVLDATSLTTGQSLRGRLTLTNRSATSVAIGQANIAVRPPGGTHDGGPFFDMTPWLPDTTLAAGASITLEASRGFTTSDPPGRWEIYPAYRDDRGRWHDGDSVAVELASGTGRGVYACRAAGARATRAFAADAIADDEGDDRAAIQQAIDAASAAGGGVVTLPAGTYRVDGPLFLRSGVRLTGVGPTTVIKAGPRFLAATGPYGGNPLITTDGAVDATLAYLTADHSGDVLPGDAGCRLCEYLIDVRRSRNVVVEGVFTRNPFSYSIAVVESTDFCVTRSNTRVESTGRYDQLDGVHILDSSRGEVLNNDIDQRVGDDGDDGLVAHNINGTVHDVLYAGNVVRGGTRGNGMQIAVGDREAHDLTIVDNEIWGSTNGIRSGYYVEGVFPLIRGVAIRDNDIHDNCCRFEGDAVNFTLGDNIADIAVTGNRVCNSGEIDIPAAPGVVIADNRGC